MNLKRFAPLLALGCALSIAQAAHDQAVKDLIPRLSADKAADRYPAQIELLDLASKASRPGAENERAALAQLLALKAADASIPQPARVWIIRQLENIGAKESIEALTALLNDKDPELRETARRALEKNSDAMASGRLRAALEQAAEDRWKIGLIHSLGERRDAASTGLITQHLDQATTAETASLALGKIATPQAVEALLGAFDKGAPGAADGLIEAAARLQAQAGPALARPIYEKLYSAQVPVSIRAAALSGLAKTNPRQSSSRLLEALSGDNPKLQQVALDALTDGRDGSPELASIYPRLPVPAKIQLLSVLGASAERQVIDAASDPDDGVRTAAVQALGRLGGKQSVPLLVRLSASENRADKAAAEFALARISGEGALPALQDAAASGQPVHRAAAITALAARRDSSSLPRLLRFAAEADSEVSKAALRALAQVATENELPEVAKLAARSNNPEAVNALKALVGRATDKAAAGTTLLALQQGADLQTQTVLAEALSVAGGPEALKAVKQLAGNEDDSVRTGAIRALSNWPDASAIPPLLELASAPDTKLNHNVLALRGVSRLVQAGDKQPSEARVEAALSGLKAARRPDEKKLLLSALAAVPHPRAAAAMRELLKDPGLQEDAGLAGLALAEKIHSSNVGAARELAQAIKEANLSDELNRKAEAVLKK